MKAILDTLANPLRVAREGFAKPVRSGAAVTRGFQHTRSPAWDATLRRMRLAMWLLVMVVSVWDITVTFGPHLGFVHRFF